MKGYFTKPDLNDWKIAFERGGAVRAEKHMPSIGPPFLGFDINLEIRR